MHKVAEDCVRLNGFSLVFLQNYSKLLEILNDICYLYYRIKYSRLSIANRVQATVCY
jgi:hypothetical protein